MCMCVDEIRFPKSVISVETGERDEGKRGGEKRRGKEEKGCGRKVKNCTVFSFVI